MNPLPSNAPDTRKIEPAALNRLERLRLCPRGKFAGKQRGERLSRHKGTSIEFADYRNYVNGDDLRHIDWSILARLDRPTIRTYQDEDDLAVYVLLDTTASMAFGTPSKFAAAQAIALSLAFVALSGHDVVYPIGIGPMTTRARAHRGRAAYSALLRWAQGSEPESRRSLAECLTQFARSSHYRPGLAIAITDGLDPNIRPALRAIAARGHEVLLLQVLSDFDLNPEIEGDIRLIDSETGAPVELTAGAEALRIYKSNLSAHCRQIEEAVNRAGGRFAAFQTSGSVVDFVVRDLRRLGVVE